MSLNDRQIDEEAGDGMPIAKPFQAAAAVA